MNVEIRGLNKRDIGKAITFAIKGMHFERYTDIPWELKVYGRYFLYMEMERASQILAAYMGNRLVGLLMADIKFEPKICQSYYRKLFVKLIDTIMRVAYANGPDSYDEANAEMYLHYREKAEPDGEICFLATDPDIQGKGVGSLLLSELEKREKGKELFLYTDSNCTYQFYERRGFRRASERRIEIKLHGTITPLTCFLYSKMI